MSRSSIHQSLATHCSHVAMARSRQATLNDPAQAMELLRSLVQPVINDEIRKIIQKYSDLYFTPALANAKRNLGPENVSDRLLSEVCKNVLENAKDIFDESSVAKKNKLMKRKGIGLGGGPKKKKKKPVGEKQKKYSSTCDVPSPLLLFLLLQEILAKRSIDPIPTSSSCPKPANQCVERDPTGSQTG